MAGGWSRDGAVQEQIDDSVADEIAAARSQLHQGDSHNYCEDCDEPIPHARRLAIPGVRRCTACQTEYDKHNRQQQLFNRRASKDSQLR